MNFPLYIAKRYVRSKSSQNAINIINLITFLVIVIGSAALFVVLSGFAGLKTFSLQFSNTFDPDLKALPATGKFFTVSKEQEARLNEIAGVASFTKELEEKVYLKYQGKSHIAIIKGIDTNYNRVTAIDSTILYGTWRVNPDQAVAGIGVVNTLGLSVNQSALVVLALKPGKGSLSAKDLKTKAYFISGVFGVEENLDKKYVFADLPSVQNLLEKAPGQVSALGFKLDDTEDLAAVKNEIAEVLDHSVVLRDRQELNSTLHRMLNTENLATYLIFTLVLIIALFNVVGAIIMMVLDKQQNLRTLYNLGTTLDKLRAIFFVQGLLVTGIGGLIGVLLGSLLIGSQIAFEWLMITPSLPYPVEYQVSNVLIVLGTIMVLGVIASKIASSRITKKLIVQ
ncbi:ABC transporter permease [Pseudozobellia thermophila]|uniref:Lipoprotein-releasing system permease protein n=1 Tax=Pseudozobellia thermophila TaxID=192903 RepID=A0A1M6BE40_9FLAO|nr:FtsX-like permease family protein [Pseudozobellia thermophila]SHI46946.1 lipoprotein-releasing system permease protein [Pseudozobellia thermophila]